MAKRRVLKEQKQEDLTSSSLTFDTEGSADQKIGGIFLTVNAVVTETFRIELIDDENANFNTILRDEIGTGASGRTDFSWTPDGGILEIDDKQTLRVTLTNNRTTGTAFVTRNRITGEN